jgi:hypothetical protein
MNTEPPTGDDLHRMLVTMKQSVLDRADDRRPAPRRRGRRTGIVIGVIALLGLGATSGGVALGMIPQPFTAAPAPTTTPSPTEPAEPSTPAAAPVEETPDPTPTPSATSTKRAFALDDPSTWTISGAEVGPVAFGGDVAAETDDLGPLYTAAPPETCPNPNVTFFEAHDEPTITISQDAGKIVGITIDGLAGGSSDEDAHAASPTTAEGAGIGTTIDELRAMYPDLEETGTYGDPGGTFSLWSIQRDGRYVTFELADDGVHVGSVWVGPNAFPPYEYCG